MSIIDKYPITSKSSGLKPFNYPWAYDFFLTQHRMHWSKDEITNLGADVADFRALQPHERNLITQILRLFTQSDIDIMSNYQLRYAQIFKPVEIGMMLSAFCAFEGIHIDAYAILLETVGLPDSEYNVFMQYEAMREKHEYLLSFDISDERSVLRNIAANGAFGEGLQLFASFAMLLNFPRFGKMQGMGQIVSWSVRDESLHCDGAIALFHQFARETGCYDDSLKAEIVQIAHKSVELEDRFIDLAFAMGPVEGMTADEVKGYIREVADWRLHQLGAVPLHERPFGSLASNPSLPWLGVLMHGAEHANFFETRVTEYSKGTTQGSWDEVWEEFDKV
jgi:ribonucleoside-diphosphate reductase beta chain